MNNSLLESFINELYNNKLNESKIYSDNTLKIMSEYNITIEDSTKFLREEIDNIPGLDKLADDIAIKLQEGPVTLTAAITAILSGVNKVLGSRLPVLRPALIIGSIRAIAAVRMNPVYEEAKRQGNKRVCARLMYKALMRVVASSLIVKLLVRAFTDGPVLKLLDNALKKVGIDLSNIGKKSDIEIASDMDKIDKVI